MQGSFDTIDLEQWPRHDQYHYFKDYAHPYCNVCTEIDVTALRAFCDHHRLSFTQASIYCALGAANEIPAFRHRFADDGVICFHQVDGRLLVLHEDDSLSFCHLDYQTEFKDYYQRACDTLAAAKATHAAFRPTHARRSDVIHLSVSPWFYLSSVSHPRNDNKGDIPKIVIARYVDRGGQLFMPVSIEVHHALMDGIHLSRFSQAMQRLAANPEHELSLP